MPSVGTKSIFENAVGAKRSLLRTRLALGSHRDASVSPGRSKMRLGILLAVGTVMVVSAAGSALSANAPSYPPHGYPCLGCDPCVPATNPVTYCDNTSKVKVRFDSKGVPIERRYRGPVNSQTNSKKSPSMSKAAIECGCALIMERCPCSPGAKK